MRRDETSMEPMEHSGAHLDEGTAHAWLDGALPADEGGRLEAHIASCRDCAALVAEARGLIAGASRIVRALDIVPGGVIPTAPAMPEAVAASDAALVDPVVRPIRPANAARPVPSSRRWMVRVAAAAVVMVGGTTLVMRSASSPNQPYAAADSSVADTVVMASSATPAPGAEAMTPPVADSTVAAASPAPAPAPVPAAPMASATGRGADRAPLPPARPLSEVTGPIASAAEPPVERQAAGGASPSIMLRAPRVAAKASVPTSPIRDSALRADEARSGSATPQATSAFAPLSQVVTTAAIPAPTPPPAAPPVEARTMKGAASNADRAAGGVAQVEGAAADAVARARSRVTAVAGCFTLDAGNAAGGWPERMTLESVVLPPGARRGYVARVPQPAADSAYWSFLAGDSVRVVWFSRGGGVDARLGPAEEGGLRGIARPFATAGSPAAPHTLVARRVACPPSR